MTLVPRSIQKILDFVNQGHADKYLYEISSTIRSRQAKIARPEKVSDDAWAVGDMARVTDVYPQYLIGGTFAVVKVNEKTIKLRVPKEPRWGKYAGRDIRFPKKSCRKMVMA